MFYPIPSLNGKYEINKKGVVRNAKTKRIIKEDDNCYSFCINYKRTVISKRRLLAEVFEFGKKDKKFYPIPSLENKYEINEEGVVRNAKTKKRVVGKANESFCFHLNGKRIWRMLQDLMWEVHGVLPQKSSVMKTPIPVQIQKYGEYHCFTSMRQCAKFLAPLIFYSERTIRFLLTKKPEELFGWKIFYKEPEKRIFKKHLFRGKKNENH